VSRCGRAWRLLQQPGGQSEAAAAFLQVLSAEPTCQEAQRALHYQRWSDAVLAERLPALTALLEGLPQPGLLQRVLADWHYRVGDRQLALADYAAQWQDTALARLPLGGLPQALVIGAPKSGTTSLAAALQRHPQLFPNPRRKELHFFQARWHWGEEWYRLQFPQVPAGLGWGLLEATPDYLQDPLVPERVAALLPEVRVVAVLREPLRRAVSWLEHLRRWGGLNQAVDAVLTDELERLEAMPEAERRSLGWWGSNALAGSFYAHQLRRWHAVLPAHRLLVVRFEDLCRNPQGTLGRILGFLGVDGEAPHPAIPLPSLNQAPASYAQPAGPLALRCRRGVLAEAVQLWQSL